MRVMKELSLRLSVLALALAALGCESTPGVVETDAGPADTGPLQPTPCDGDEECVGSYCNAGSHLCCVPASPAYEICGDRIDQNCDRRDQSCGDNDSDGIAACRPGEDPASETCDCNDERSDVRPRFGSVPGAPEACDGADNDCNGRTDEHAECCEACEFLGTARERADLCTTAGECDCTTDEGIGPCPEGQTCCTAGCVDVQTDITNCGFCGSACLVSSDRCVAGDCRCGDTEPCLLDLACEAGVCPE